MKRVSLGTPPINGTADQKLDWCIKSIQALAQATYADDPNVYADAFSMTNLTETRALDANCGVLANLSAAQAAIDATRDVLLTFIQDHKQRGSKSRSS